MNHSWSSKGNQETNNNLWEKFHLKVLAKKGCFQVANRLIKWTHLIILLNYLLTKQKKITVKIREKRTDPRKPPNSVKGWDDTSHCLNICIPQKTMRDNVDARSKEWLLEMAINNIQSLLLKLD